MHELAIAEAIAGVADRHAGGRRITRVEVAVGRLRRVVPRALSSSFELVTRGTLLEGAELELIEIPAAGRCRNCGAEPDLPELPFRCPACGSFDLEVVRGGELSVESVDVDDRFPLSASCTRRPPLRLVNGGSR